ncbi:hypothetical protein ACTXK0_05235 [Corynebacterium variabile]
MPDFAEHYHLRLVAVVEDYTPAEALLLIYGLPARSRFQGRLMGEKRPGWDDMQWLTLDLRNAVEALRTMKVNEGKKKGAKPTPFREWEARPGREAEKRRAASDNLAKLRRSVRTSGGRLDR